MGNCVTNTGAQIHGDMKYEQCPITETHEKCSECKMRQGAMVPRTLLLYQNYMYTYVSYHQYKFNQ